MAFIILGFSQVVHAFNMRSDSSLSKTGVFTNRKLNAAAAASSLLMLLVLFTPLHSWFGLSDLPLVMYAVAIGLAFSVVIVVELSKDINCKNFRKKKIFTKRT